MHPYFQTLHTEHWDIQGLCHQHMFKCLSHPGGQSPAPFVQHPGGLHNLSLHSHSQGVLSVFQRMLHSPYCTKPTPAATRPGPSAGASLGPARKG